VKKVSILGGLLILMALPLWSQPPQAFNYQAIVRDGQGEPVKNQEVAVRIIINMDSTTGTRVYAENHLVTTNGFGNINLQIGQGTTSDSFESIDWSGGKVFLRVRVDPAGGTSWTDAGTSQLLSVPYALYAGNGTPGPRGDSGIGIANAVIEDEKLVVTFSDGTKDTLGTVVGSPGPMGLKGDSGTGITNAVIEDENLVITYSDGTKDTVGSVVGPPGPIGPKGDSGSPGIQGPPGLNGVGVITAGPNVTITGSGAESDPYVIGASPTYSVGLDTSLGGYVFYVTPNGKHGLVAALQDQNKGSSYNGTYSFYNDSWYSARDICNDPAYHDEYGREFSDWRLPSLREINLMYSQRNDIGGFSGTYYWTFVESSEFQDSDQVLRKHFSSGGWSRTSKENQSRTRAVRSF
jgi:hypothetical protein